MVRIDGHPRFEMAEAESRSDAPRIFVTQWKRCAAGYIFPQNLLIFWEEFAQVMQLGREFDRGGESVAKGRV